MRRKKKLLCLYLEILWHEVLTNILTTINNKQCPDPGFLMALKANEVLRGFFFLKLLHTKSTNILIYKWHSITNKNNFKCSFQITLAIQLNSVRVINVGPRFITLSEFRIFWKTTPRWGHWDWPNPIGWLNWSVSINWPMVGMHRNPWLKLKNENEETKADNQK